MTGDPGDATRALVAAYFDSALVAKFYLNEPGRTAVRRLAAHSGIVVTSGIAIAEVAAAFHRKLREGSLDRPTFRAVSGQFEHDTREGLWQLIWPTEALLEQVQTLYSSLDASVFLRAMDALHVVTAKSESFARIYTNDRHLLAACRAVGLEGIDPTIGVERPLRPSPRRGGGGS